MIPAKVFTCFICAQLCLLTTGSKRLYVNQFPPGSEHVPLPKVVVISLYMGEINYPYLQLYFESIRWNKEVDFKVVNIVPEGGGHEKTSLNLSAIKSIPNLQIVTISIHQWSDRVQQRLNITSLNLTMAWYYKMCDFKPVLGYLFPEFTGSEYKYWGFADMDVIWGNFSRFSSWFQGQPVVISGWWRSTGAAHFFINEDWTKSLMLEDVKYLELLADPIYHNLDEEGTQTDPKNVIDDGAHSLASKLLFLHDSKKITMTRGKDWQDHCFLDEGDSVDWAGPIVWFRGSLRVLHGSPIFPPGRELLFYHRPHRDLDYPIERLPSVLDDMITYGYLLPTWIPLLSRFTCLESLEFHDSTVSSLLDYQPYHHNCMEKDS